MVYCFGLGFLVAFSEVWNVMSDVSDGNGSDSEMGRGMGKMDEKGLMMK